MENINKRWNLHLALIVPCESNIVINEIMGTEDYGIFNMEYLKSGFLLS